jgi:hypothetical protein
MKKTFCPPVSLTEALSGKRIRVSHFERGSALCALTHSTPVELAAPEPILGYWHRPPGRLTVYLPGSMPAELRTAMEEQRTQEEVVLRPLGSIREVDLSDCRREFRVLLKWAA